MKYFHFIDFLLILRQIPDFHGTGDSSTFLSSD